LLIWDRWFRIKGRPTKATVGNNNAKGKKLAEPLIRKMGNKSREMPENKSTFESRLKGDFVCFPQNSAEILNRNKVLERLMAIPVRKRPGWGGKTAEKIR
jgi:hypothetical protein